MPAFATERGGNTVLLRLLPFMLWLPRVKRTTLQQDLIAALTGAIVVLPQGVAFATIAGIPPRIRALCRHGSCDCCRLVTVLLGATEHGITIVGA